LQDLQKNYDWLKTNALDYAGQWVALDSGQLVAQANTLKELLSQITVKRDLSNRPLIHKIGKGLVDQNEIHCD